MSATVMIPVTIPRILRERGLTLHLVRADVKPLPLVLRCACCRKKLTLRDRMFSAYEALCHQCGFGKQPIYRRVLRAFKD